MYTVTSWNSGVSLNKRVYNLYVSANTFCATQIIDIWIFIITVTSSSTETWLALNCDLRDLVTCRRPFNNSYNLRSIIYYLRIVLACLWIGYVSIHLLSYHPVPGHHAMIDTEDLQYSNNDFVCRPLNLDFSHFRLRVNESYSSSVCSRSRIIINKKIK